MDIQNVTQSSEVKKAIVILREMNADARIRQEAYYREKRLHDEATALGHARREGLAEGLAEGEAKGRAEGEAKGRAEGEAIGEAKGILVTLRDLVNKGLLTLTQAAAQAGMTVPEFENKVRLL